MARYMHHNSCFNIELVSKTCDKCFEYLWEVGEGGGGALEMGFAFMKRVNLRDVPLFPFDVFCIF